MEFGHGFVCHGWGCNFSFLLHCFNFLWISIRFTIWLKCKKQFYIMLILSTLFHLLCIFPLASHASRASHAPYISIILLSTVLSVTYHAYNESHPVINAMDYTMACIWFLYDASYWDAWILAANAGSFLAHSMVPLGASYPYYHSAWHLLNALKCYYVSIRISIL